MAANTAINRVSRAVGLWSPVLGCMGIIFYASSLPGKDIPSLFAYQDILFHGLIYAILALFFYRALKNTFPRLVFLQLLVLTALFGVSYGASDELHQLLVPGRNCSGFDLLIDFIGSLTGVLIGGLFQRWLK
jgi:VanZ family protein